MAEDRVKADWDARNRRRVHLIERDLAGVLGNVERQELVELQASMAAELNAAVSLPPLPVPWLRAPRPLSRGEYELVWERVSPSPHIEDAASDIQGRLRDSRSLVRERAVCDLARFGSPSSKDGLRRIASEDPSPGVRWAAREALEALGDLDDD